MKTISDYTIYCTEEQTRKAIQLDAPIEVQEFIGGELADDWCYDITTNYACKVPTAEQLIGFLRSKGIQFYFNDATKYWRFSYNSKFVSRGWCEQKELAAIDAALKYLTNNKK